MTRAVVALIPCALGACLAGCAPAEPACEGEPVEYEEVHGLPGLGRMIGVCELFGGAAVTAGVFRIDEIVGRLESTAAGYEVARIHVTAATEAVWFGSVPSRFTFSFPGGCDTSGLFLTPPLSARRGERVVLVGPVESEPQVFREISPGRFSNGQLFSDSGVELAELRAVAQNVHASATCPYDEDFGVAP